MDIESLNDALAYKWRDEAGGVVSNGDVCIDSDYYDFMKQSHDGQIIVDMSSLNEVSLLFLKDAERDTYSINDIILKRTNDVLHVTYDSAKEMHYRYCVSPFPHIFIVEYFLVDGVPIPFAHGYSTQFNVWPISPLKKGYEITESQFKLTPEKRILQRMLKIGHGSVSGLSLRLPKFDIVEKPVREILTSVSKLKTSEKYIEFKYMDTKAGRLMKKIITGVARRDAWRRKTNEYPTVVLSMNNDGENYFTKKHLFTKNFLLAPFYNKIDYTDRDLVVYCTHPTKDHKEVFFRFRKKTV